MIPLVLKPAATMLGFLALPSRCAARLKRNEARDRSQSFKICFASPARCHQRKVIHYLRIIVRIVRDLGTAFKGIIASKNIIIRTSCAPPARRLWLVFPHRRHIIAHSARSDESTSPRSCLSRAPFDGCFVLFQRGEEHHGLVTLSRVPTSGSTINLPQQLCPCTCLSLCKGDGKSFLVIIFPLAYAHFAYRT